MFRTISANYIINFATETHVDNSIEESLEFIKTNILGTHSILESLKSMVTKNGNNKVFKFLNISTDEVFGSLEENEEFCGRFKYHPNSHIQHQKLVLITW